MAGAHGARHNLWTSCPRSWSAVYGSMGMMPPRCQQARRGWHHTLHTHAYGRAHAATVPAARFQSAAAGPACLRQGHHRRRCRRCRRRHPICGDSKKSTTPSDAHGHLLPYYSPLLQGGGVGAPCVTQAFGGARWAPRGLLPEVPHQGASRRLKCGGGGIRDGCAVTRP